MANLTGAKTAEFLPQLVAEIPWGHHRLILDKMADPAAPLYYLHATARFGWSLNVLLDQGAEGSGLDTGQILLVCLVLLSH